MVTCHTAAALHFKAGTASWHMPLTDYLHCNDVMISAMASQIISLKIVSQPFIQAQMKENIKALGHWPLTGEFTSDGWIPRTKGR